MVTDNIKDKDAQKFFPFVVVVFSFILLLNLIGLVPYSFTLTGHLIVTLVISFSIFIGINILAVRAHGLQFFGLFLPAGTSVPLAFFLFVSSAICCEAVPVEEIDMGPSPLISIEEAFAELAPARAAARAAAAAAAAEAAEAARLFAERVAVFQPLFGEAGADAAARRLAEGGTVVEATTIAMVIGAALELNGQSTDTPVLGYLAPNEFRASFGDWGAAAAVRVLAEHGTPEQAEAAAAAAAAVLAGATGFPERAVVQAVADLSPGVMDNVSASQSVADLSPGVTDIVYANLPAAATAPFCFT